MSTRYGYSLETEKAAVRIQTFFRVYLARKRFKLQQKAVRLIQSYARGWLARKRLAKQKASQQRSERFEAAIDRHRQRIQVLRQYQREIASLPAERLEAWEDKHHRAALLIQAQWRGHVARKNYALLPQRWRRQAAAKLLQRSIQAKLRSSREAARLREMDPPPTDSPSSSVQWAPGVAQRSATPLLNTRSRAADLRDGLAESSDVLIGSQASFPDLRRSHGGENPPTSTHRRKVLLHQIERDLKEAGKNPLLDHLDGQLLSWRYRDAYADWDQHKYHSGSSERERQRVVQQTEALMGYLEQLPPPSELPEDVEPHEFSLPPAKSTRWAAAKQAHALALAEARVGGQWWRHLKPLNRRSVHETWQDDEEREWRERLEVLRATHDAILDRERARVLPSDAGTQQRSRSLRALDGVFVSMSGLMQPDRGAD